MGEVSIRLAAVCQCPRYAAGIEIRGTGGTERLGRKGGIARRAVEAQRFSRARWALTQHLLLKQIEWGESLTQDLRIVRASTAGRRFERHSQSTARTGTGQFMPTACAVYPGSLNGYETNR
jgi:hypothetical protein